MFLVIIEYIIPIVNRINANNKRFCFIFFVFNVNKSGGFKNVSLFPIEREQKRIRFDVISPETQSC